jgi:3-deoxy-D-manno-octulosonate 8-phosphate phosphatase KdsC-like HAD superfamily phosphatase
LIKVQHEASHNEVALNEVALMGSEITVISTRLSAKHIELRTISIEIGRIRVGLRTKQIQIGPIQVQVAVNSVEIEAI